MRTTSWRIPALRRGVVERGEDGGLGVEAGVAVRTTLSTWLSMGERIRVRGTDRRSARRARFSTRESPRPTAPPRSIAAATRGEPRTALVTP